MRLLSRKAQRCRRLVLAAPGGAAGQNIGSRTAQLPWSYYYAVTSRDGLQCVTAFGQPTAAGARECLWSNGDHGFLGWQAPGLLDFGVVGYGQALSRYFGI